MLNRALLEPPENSMYIDDPDEQAAGRPAGDSRPLALSTEMALQRIDPIKPGSIVLIESQDGSRSEKYFVRRSSRNGATHSIRLVRSTSAANEA